MNMALHYGDRFFIVEQNHMNLIGQNGKTTLIYFLLHIKGTDLIKGTNRQTH